MRNWRLRLVLLLTVLNVIGAIAVIPYQVELTGEQPIPEDTSTLFIVIINLIVQIIYMFVLTLVGVRLQNRTELSAPILNGLVYPEERKGFSKKWLINTIVVTLIGTVIVLVLDLFVFNPLIGEPMEQLASPSWWKGLFASIYGGFTEELMARLFTMTFIVWLLAWFTKKRKGSIPNSFYYIAIVLSAILFGLGHLGTAMQAFGGLSAVIVIRTLVLNGLLGLWFGYLYWKRGLEYAIIAHIIADIILHVLTVLII